MKADVEFQRDRLRYLDFRRTLDAPEIYATSESSRGEEGDVLDVAETERG